MRAVNATSQLSALVPLYEAELIRAGNVLYVSTGLVAGAWIEVSPSEGQTQEQVQALIDDTVENFDTAVVVPVGTSGVAIDLTIAAMTKARVLTANTSFDLINPVEGKVTIVHVKQAAASSFTATFADVDVWVGTEGVHPTQSAGFDVIDAWTFWYDGTLLYGTWASGE